MNEHMKDGGMVKGGQSVISGRRMVYTDGPVNLEASGRNVCLVFL